MARYCSVCGRRLRKAAGTVGPVCERKYCMTKSDNRRMSKKERMRLAAHRDIFGED